MQKLYAMFPPGAPGIALLLLRWFLGLELAFDIAAVEPILACILGVCAVAMVFGLLTPVAAVAAALVELYRLAPPVLHGTPQGISSIVIGVALALLGPGAWSIDARLFGRHLLRFPQSENETK